MRLWVFGIDKGRQERGQKAQVTPVVPPSSSSHLYVSKMLILRFPSNQTGRLSALLTNKENFPLLPWVGRSKPSMASRLRPACLSLHCPWHPMPASGLSDVTLGLNTVSCCLRRCWIRRVIKNEEGTGCDHEEPDEGWTNMWGVSYRCWTTGHLGRKGMKEESTQLKSIATPILKVFSWSW